MNNIDLANLTPAQGFKISGAAVGDLTGISVSNAGDINGDGIADLIVGAHEADPYDRDRAGTVYVIYGKNGNLNDIDLANLTPAQGFKISGMAAGDQTGWPVSSAGDINGDGIVDLIVGASEADPSGRLSAGAAYVIYGKSDGLSDIDLANLTLEQGFKILGAAADDRTGISVSSAGDINNDDITDLVVGASGSTGDDEPLTAGAAYVIYGKSSGLDNIDLLNLTLAQGFKISGMAAGDQTGWPVSSAGDINGDGIADLIVGAHEADPYDRDRAGTVYVIYGKNGNLNDIDLASLTLTQGFKISGAVAKDLTGWSVNGAGDINGDGITDLVVGASAADPSGRANAGAAYVIYGKSGDLNNIDLASLTLEQGFKISGAVAVDRAGISVNSAGDINGDGIADLIIGAYAADPGGREMAGAAYVIYGKNGNLNDIDLASLTLTQGFKILGAATNDEAGYSVSNAGDINGDGIDDLVIGAPGADPNGRVDAGAAYVIYGTGDSENNPPTISAFTKTGTEDVTVTFSVSDFTSHYSDIDGDPLAKIQIVGLSENGLLELSRVDVTLNQEILPDNLESLTFNPNSGWHGETSVSWKASDGSLYSDTADVSLSITADPDPDDSAAAVYGDLSTLLVGVTGLFLAEVLL